MSWSQYLPQDRIKWTYGYWSHPIWPSEPDVAVIEEVVASVLPEKADDFSVQFLADGANHKVYEVSHISWSKTYLFRIAVPLDPWLKMESEIATLMFLGQKTAIPVPKPIAWSSSAQGKLGYEWALLEKLPGVKLADVWNTAPWEKKLQITEAMAELIVQLWVPNMRFAKIGSLYLDQAKIYGHRILKRDDNEESQPTDHLTEETGSKNFDKDEFTIGPAVDSEFYTNRRRYLAANRGPYESCHDWLSAFIGIERDFIRTAKVLLESKDEMTPAHKDEKWRDLEYEIGFDDEEIEEDYDDMVALCDKYQTFLPLVFPPHETSQNDNLSCVLYHHDLRHANILVDPETFTITGIIDWEEICAVPDWYGVGYPLFIQDDEPYEEGEPPVPTTYDEDSSDYNAVKVGNRDRWEAKQLRERFDHAVQGLLGIKDWRHTAPEDKLKSRFLGAVAGLSDNWCSAKSAMTKIGKAMETLEPVENDGSNSE